MRISRFFSFMAVVTSFSLLYVYQQTEIFRLAYMGQKKMAVYQVLLDKNSLLRYNKEKSTSLIRIGDKLSGNKDFQMPTSYRLVKLTYPAKARAKANLAKKEGILSRIFGVRKQAEAKTVNPY